MHVSIYLTYIHFCNIIRTFSLCKCTTNVFFNDGKVVPLIEQYGKAGKLCRKTEEKTYIEIYVPAELLKKNIVANFISFFHHSLDLACDSLTAALSKTTMFLVISIVWKMTTAPCFHALTFKVSPGKTTLVNLTFNSSYGP